MSEAPIRDYLYSDRKTVRQPQSLGSADELKSFLEENAIDYILIAPEIEWQENYVPTYSDETVSFLPLIADMESRDQLTMVYSLDRGLIQVYKTRVQE